MKIFRITIVQITNILSHQIYFYAIVRKESKFLYILEKELVFQKDRETLKYYIFKYTINNVILMKS